MLSATLIHVSVSKINNFRPYRFHHFSKFVLFLQSLVLYRTFTKVFFFGDYTHFMFT